MAVDFSKLTPRPWEMATDDKGGLLYYLAAPGGYPLLLAEDDDERGEAALRFVALARNAFDVMTRRLWFPRFIGTENGMQRWVAYSWSQVRDLRSTTAAVFSQPPSEWGFSDPFTALVEADRWYRENVENSPEA